MEEEEIVLSGLQQAMKRGESLSKAMQTFINAGYKKSSVERAAKRLRDFVTRFPNVRTYSNQHEFQVKREKETESVVEGELRKMTEKKTEKGSGFSPPSSESEKNIKGSSEKTIQPNRLNVPGMYQTQQMRPIQPAQTMQTEQVGQAAPITQTIQAIPTQQTPKPLRISYGKENRSTSPASKYKVFYRPSLQRSFNYPDLQKKSQEKKKDKRWVEWLIAALIIIFTLLLNGFLIWKFILNK